jgi:heme/copper-type cytochrome/quinol oxidase subunit 2
MMFFWLREARRIAPLVIGMACFLPAAARADIVLADCPAILRAQPGPFASVEEIKKQVACNDWLRTLDDLRHSFIPPVYIQGIVAGLASGLLLFRATEPRDAMRITVTGRQFAWSVDYSEGTRSEACIIQGEIVLPQGRPVLIDITSEDVIHEWIVPALGLKTDAVPGRLNRVAVETSKLAEYEGGATKISGSGFAEMAFTLRIVDQNTYLDWEKRMLQDKGCPRAKNAR